MPTSRYPLTPVAVALAVALALGGCDSSYSTIEDEAPELPPPTIELTADLAAAVATALAVAPGGALNDLAEAVSMAGTPAAAPGCDLSRAYDEATQMWTRDIACERGSADGAFYALFARTHHLRFLDASGTPQQQPTDAASMDVALVAGEGLHRTPRRSHTLTDIGAALSVAGLPGPMVTVNGTSGRAATDTLGAPAAGTFRTHTYAVALAFEDVVGPRRALDLGMSPTPHLGPLHAWWARALSGTVQGEIAGTMTAVTPNGTRERTYARTFTLTFGSEREATATLRFPDATFTIDLETGAVRG